MSRDEDEETAILPLTSSSSTRSPTSFSPRTQPHHYHHVTILIHIKFLSFLFEMKVKLNHTNPCSTLPIPRNLVSKRNQESTFQFHCSNFDSSKSTLSSSLSISHLASTHTAHSAAIIHHLHSHSQFKTLIPFPPILNSSILLAKIHTQFQTLEPSIQPTIKPISSNSHSISNLKTISPNF
ncbi:hypothetical protein QVD17_17974 [Tagetes erecta]|uniref:Uncharacterized protein n=1 Tax=Tagetes erecta TaxID=13708 RepID=A0AAD8NVC7_TARER|nr:hypothetical protein QVD17_17974 [Tagetes erecta]